MFDAPDWVLALPAVNASLNGLATVLLLAGYAAIRGRRVQAHRRLMIAAFAVSTVFLACYLVYHYELHERTGASGRPFGGTGWIRPVYFAILISHVLLAMLVALLAPVTLTLGLRRDWPRHRWIARVTFPVWVYVSITGVVIYLLLYHWPTETQ
jgi:protein SCO1/2/putative membrane protein